MIQYPKPPFPNQKQAMPGLTMPEDAVVNFSKQVPMKRPGQPAELASAFVMLADPISSYVSRATIAVTGGKDFMIAAIRGGAALALRGIQQVLGSALRCEKADLLQLA